ncbi:rust resistance kinase Lr10-like isoform X2 [Juglans microcarpa x Juglans regia]|uniref:rust resistance kinase Lr10-like isoform X2 n=1 Tax=Juglans microcarpa x Juglans regia TaxID=2249226 RepID=UPI001B7DF258|nr:rust resistance kinase Lr10-like isoform X2 [Juglans microcarpa x Juglans regia]
MAMMIISYFFLFVVIFILPTHVQGRNHECADSLRCGGHGQAVRFPFRLKDRHPDHCDFRPGFLLSCTDKNQTVLDLPDSVKLFVENIDFKSRRIQLYHPDRCFPRDIRHLNLSSSPFQFTTDYALDDYAFFNCSRKKTEEDEYYTRIYCLSGPTHQVHALAFEDSIIYFPLPPCTRIYNVRSIPRRYLESNDDPTIYMKWSRSPDEAKGTFSKKTKLVTAGAVISSFLVLLVVFALQRAYINNMVEKEYRAKIEKFLEDYRNFKPTRYSYADIKKITNQFAEKLGQGAYGTVFKGKLSNQIHVAVKILNNSSKENGEEFINEVGIMGRIHHVNVVRLVGFCADGFRRALVYEFLSNYSLEKFIFSANVKNRFLGWNKLQDIAIGVAKGIEYLHQGCDHQILHFDIKPHNVLLDDNFNPKISDFGLAKLCSKDQSVVSMTTGRGTMGYIAPEVFSRNFGNVSYKADVYSFGMLLLEIVGGKRNVDVTAESTSKVYFPEWIYNLLDQKEELRVFIEDDGDTKIVEQLAIVGLWCIQWHPMDRPSMKLVVQMLEGQGDKLVMPPNPFASSSPTRIQARKPTTRLGQELEAIQELD